MLDFTPKDIAICNEKYFYVYKENLYAAETLEINNINDENSNDEKAIVIKNNANDHSATIRKDIQRIQTKQVKLPMKINAITTNNNELIATNKKIVYLSPYKVLKQLYGPTMKITKTSHFEDNILAICYGTNDIYLFQNKISALFTSESQPLCCLLTSKDEFYIGCQDGIYIYSTNKKKHTKKIDLTDVYVLRKHNDYIFAGCKDKLVVIKDCKVLENINLCGFVNDMLVWDNKLIVCFGREMNDGRHFVNKKAKNMLHIYAIDK